MQSQTFVQEHEKKDAQTRRILSSTFFLRKVPSILKQQEKAVCDEEFSCDPDFQAQHFSSINAIVRSPVCEAAENPIKSSETLNLVLIVAPSDKLQTVARCVQIYGDKSQTLLKADDLRSYPLHIILLNFST